MKSDREIWAFPVLRAENSTDSLEFAPVCVAGHNRYYLLMRKYGKVESAPWLFRASKTTEYHSLLSLNTSPGWSTRSLP